VFTLAHELFLLRVYTSAASALLTRTVCCYLPISSNFLSSRSVAKGPPLSPCETNRQSRQSFRQLYLPSYQLILFAQKNLVNLYPVTVNWSPSYPLWEGRNLSYTRSNIAQVDFLMNSYFRLQMKILLIWLQWLLPLTHLTVRLLQIGYCTSCTSMGLLKRVRLETVPRVAASWKAHHFRM
jgi:hypothetical protein